MSLVMLVTTDMSQGRLVMQSCSNVFCLLRDTDEMGAQYARVPDGSQSSSRCPVTAMCGSGDYIKNHCGAECHWHQTSIVQLTSLKPTIRGWPRSTTIQFSAHCGHGHSKNLSKGICAYQNHQSERVLLPHSCSVRPPPKLLNIVYHLTSTNFNRCKRRGHEINLKKHLHTRYQCVRQVS